MISGWDSVGAQPLADCLHLMYIPIDKGCTTLLPSALLGLLSHVNGLQAAMMATSSMVMVVLLQLLQLPHCQVGSC